MVGWVSAEKWLSEWVRQPPWWGGRLRSYQSSEVGADEPRSSEVVSGRTSPKIWSSVGRRGGREARAAVDGSESTRFGCSTAGSVDFGPPASDDGATEDRSADTPSAEAGSG
ncbi:hypothetical protein Acsp05_54000 [Actinokineospora sp. NBRC 105648]|nr:hypothetical protein Acsp05_54000 [Actinokineospora sp. NBRC 105648]